MPELEKFYFKKKGTVAPSFCPVLRLFPQFPAELVVHSTEWTTSSQLLPRFAPLSQVSDRASGPLSGVDHWLLALALFWTIFPVS